jgi:3-phenylpropionate/trans-cinnamate dioxygenase ferredoxin reductase subunit
LAGHRAAVQARRLRPELDITVLAAERELPYQRPPLSKGYLMGTVSANRVQLRGAAEGYRFRPLTAATGLDLDRREVITDHDVEPFDQLVVATGAHPRHLDAFPPSEGIIYLRTLADATRIRDAFGHIRHLTIIGGGFIGAEVAMSARHHHIDVTLVEQSPHLLSRAVGLSVSNLVEEHLRHEGVTLVTGREATQIHDGLRMLVNDGSQTWETGLIVVGVGVVPTIEWLDGALPVNDDGGIAVSQHGLVVGFESISAIGDVASWYHPLYKRPLRFEHFEVATNQAMHAVAALFGNQRKPYEELPFGWSDQGGLLIQILGLPSPDLVEVEEPVDGGRCFLYYRGERLEGAVLIDAAEALTTVRERIISSLTNDM